MNKDQALEFGRWIVAVGGGFFIGKGWLTAEQLNTISSNLPVIVPAVISIGTLLWGLVTRSDRNKVVGATTVPGVKAVVVDTSAAPASVTATAHDVEQPKVLAG